MQNTQVNAVAIKPNEVSNIWPQIEPLICRALEHDPSGQTVETAKERIDSGEYLLILMMEKHEMLAALTVELNIIHGEKVCNIVTAGGSQLDKWEDPFLDALEVLAKEQGASKLTLYGRPAWAKRLKGRGFRPILTVLELSL